MKKCIVYHNQKCSTSRKVLEYLSTEGFEITVKLYLKDLLSKKELENLYDKVENQDLFLRKKENEFKLMEIKPTSKKQIIDAIFKNPILMERPIVEFENKAIVARPLDIISSIL